MFIAVTDAKTGAVVMLNIDNIATFEPNGLGGTVVTFTNGVERHFKNTPDAVAGRLDAVSELIEAAARKRQSPQE